MIFVEVEVTFVHTRTDFICKRLWINWIETSRQINITTIEEVITVFTLERFKNSSNWFFFQVVNGAINRQRAVVRVVW